ncbi:MAG: carboxypeptidase-like regulatory domain-containing protein [Phycisphaerae bacterium]|nr:carboxypeptidase-like regulatory domain-containing protein [Phycisphaerae bacterium]
MKKSIWLIIVPGLFIAAGAIYFARGHSKEVENLIETVLPAIIPEEPSPYSMKWGAELARVVDQDGKGVPEATVTFDKYLARDCDGNITEEPPAWQGTAITTNEKGEFVYPGVIWQDEDGDKKPQPQITIEAEGFLKRSGVSVGVNYSNERGEIDIFRIGRIEGAIIDPNGQPLANVPVWFNTHTRYKNPNSSCGGCFSANLKTDEAGGFVIEKVPPGMHIVKFPGHAGGCGPEPKVEKIPYEEYASFQTINMKDGEVKSNIFIDLRQDRAIVKGKVVDKYNRPMSGVNAVLYREIKQYYADGSGWSSHTESLKSALSDENGDYILKHVPPGDYQIKADYPYEKGKNYDSGKPLTIYLAGRQEVTFNLVLERQDDSLPKPHNREESLFEVPLPEGLAERDMMIVDPRGNGISGANVVFDTTITTEDHKTLQKTTKEWNGASLTTDSRGVFVLPSVLEELEGKWVQCRAAIEVEGFEKHQVWLGAHYLKKERRFDILPIGEMRGRLIGLDGMPVKGRVEMRDSMRSYRSPNSELSSGGYHSQVTDDGGKFVFEKIPEGTHIIHYTVDGRDADEKRTGAVIVYTQGGQDIDDMVIDLRQDTCSAHGRVLDWAGKPVKNATVRLVKTIQWGYRG